MADSAQDKRLPATQRKINKARKEGQVARSRDLGHLAALGLGVAIVIFFTSDNWNQFVVASFIYGVMAAGADVAWHLWVTKIAPPERVADYMASHTFLTGVRGALGPVIGFLALEYFSKDWIPGCVIVLVLAACYLLVPEWRSEKARRTSA